jgi:transposase
MTLPENRVAGFALLPDIQILHYGTDGLWTCQKVSEFEVCPRCATPSRAIYDRRWVLIRDEPLRSMPIRLKIHKRRFFCATCHKPFTEPVAGVLPRRRTTQRFRRAVMEACERYTDLKRVREDFQVSYHFLYSAYYERVKLNLREREGAPWPSAIGIDEHSYGKNRETRSTQFVSVIVNHNRKKMFEAVLGKTQAEMEQATAHIPGRENVLWATLDLCDPYRNYIRSFFPNAKCVADKFHVLRLLSPALLKKRKEITGTRANLKAKRLLLVSAHDLRYGERVALEQFLKRYPVMHELWVWKERLHAFYRIKGYGRAYERYKKLMDEMSVSFLPEIQTLRKTLLKWKEEILNYFQTGLTNARLEGFNNKASLLKRRAYGYRNPENYRLQLLNACSR